MARSHAEAYHMDSDDPAAMLGTFPSQVEARHQCSRHAEQVLSFRVRHTGLWKAQGQRHWYQIRRLDD